MEILVPHTRGLTVSTVSDSSTSSNTAATTTKAVHYPLRMTLNDVVFEAGIDNINLFPLLEYIEKAYKLLDRTTTDMTPTDVITSTNIATTSNYYYYYYSPAE